MTFAERYAQLARAREGLAAARRIAPSLERLWCHAERFVDAAQSQADEQLARTLDAADRAEAATAARVARLRLVKRSDSAA